MQLWCSARDTAWTWTWQAYPGVWLFIFSVGLGVILLNRAGARAAGAPYSPSHPLLFAGLIILWLALDWPIGALGAGYLASVHMLQFILIALLAPPALLRAVSADALRLIGSRPILSRILRRLTYPLTSLILFNATVLLTHVPFVVDSLMTSQAGSFLIDILWLLSGLLFWWPLVLERPAHPRFVPPLKMLYVVGGLMFSPIMFGLVGFMVYAEHPLYGIYELAPPFEGYSAIADLQVAGTMMSILGALVAFITLSVIFFRWSARDG
ncbi:MAG: cytochrome c oxidase assembly protein [Gemmatimonadota bacterium]